MTILFAVLFVLVLGLTIFLLIKNKQLDDEVLRVNNWAQASVAEAQKDAEQKIAVGQQESQAAVVEAQKLIDQQFAEMQQESERVRQHYESESRKIQEAADALVSKTIKDFEPLRKYENLRDAEAEVQRQLAAALTEATSLRAEAQTLMEQARNAAANERSMAVQKAKDIHEQADARLNQALHDAGRIIAEAEKRAEQIGGDAYTALRDKEMLEQAAEAMRNVIEGYGDRYLIPTHSLLDDLAAEYGYDAAGQALVSARNQSKRMVEQGEAAACDYVEASRRNTAIQFVIHAFNGSVDATLTRVKSDNFGILEQRIRDSFSIVNKDGSAFRNARILPAYLDARLAELKWAVVVQELVLRDREEQRFQNERRRDEQRAKEAQEKQMREAEKEKALIAAAVAEAEKRFAQASADQKEQSEKELQELRQKLTDATTRELTIAQQTNKGRIYIISNVGSFGEGVYKIGLTRRPAEERVDELSSASVPFEFDIHAVIETDHAPGLEYKLQQQLLATRINKINLRKEFFRVSLNDIRDSVIKLEQGKDFNGTVTWTEKAKAQQYHDSLDIERDSQAKEKWLKRTQLIAERRERAASRLSVSNGHETDKDSLED
jgi:F0F1-type ATP synthase membrane subunit b/b'